MDRHLRHGGAHIIASSRPHRASARRPCSPCVRRSCNPSGCPHRPPRPHEASASRARRRRAPSGPASSADRAAPVRCMARTARSCAARAAWSTLDPLPTRQTGRRKREDEAFGGLATDRRRCSRTYHWRPTVPVAASVPRPSQGDRGGKLIDVGIGTGLLHLAREGGFTPLGCEISPGAAEGARSSASTRSATSRGGRRRGAVGDHHGRTWSSTRRIRAASSRTCGRAAASGGALFVAVPNHRSTLFLAADVLAPRAGSIVDGEPPLVPEPLPWYFTPATLVRLSRASGCAWSQCGASPYLGRFTFSFPVRAGLATLIALGKLTGLEARSRCTR